MAAGERLVHEYILRKIRSILNGEKIKQGSETILSNLNVNRGTNETR